MLCLLAWLPAHGEVYKCLDETGETTYQARPCPESSAGKEVDIAQPPPSAGAGEPGKAADAPPGRTNSQTTESGRSEREEREMAQKRRECERVRREYEKAKRRKQAMEERIVADCKRRRETYCNLSASEILQRNQTRDDRKMMGESPRIRRNYNRLQKRASRRTIPDPEPYRQELRRLECDRF